jgi:hypothetical protein
MADNKDIRKLTKTPAWKVVKNHEAVLKIQESHLEEIQAQINLAKISFKYPLAFDKVEQRITSTLWNFDTLRNGDKKESGRQALREKSEIEYSEIKLEIENIQTETGFNLSKPETWQ